MNAIFLVVAIFAFATTPSIIAETTAVASTTAERISSTNEGPASHRLLRKSNSQKHDDWKKSNKKHKEDKDEKEEEEETEEVRKTSKKTTTKQWTVGSGETFMVDSVDGLEITSKSKECTLVTGTGEEIASTCLVVSTTTLANHEMGPWCNGGFWDKKNVWFPDDMVCSCLCQRFDCDTTCNDLCIECTPESQQRNYIFPLEPVISYTTDRDELTKCIDDNNVGDGLALNGVPMAKSDPYDELTSQNNIAPLDPNGGHSTLQMTYHYHAIPTIFFDCKHGWDPTNYAWADVAPNGNHSPLIGWSLDGLPVFGPYSNNGEVPTDLDDCGAHTHGSYGMHYHANFGGDTNPSAFNSCYRGARAKQDWDGSKFGDTEGESVRALRRRLGDKVTCPVTTYGSAHAIEDSESEYLLVTPQFKYSKCVDVDRVLKTRR